MTRTEPGPVRVVLAAIGGYGYYYLQALLAGFPPGEACLAGVVDPEARASRAWEQVRGLKVPVCASFDEFYAAGHEADLAVIVSPIQWHVPQSVTALGHGSRVLCDKPLGASVEDARELLAARDRAGCWVMVGYQWSYSAAIQALKRDILAGRFGRPRRFSTLCCWPRDFAYYGRNRWAGRLRDPESGRQVRDTPANNAMAHFLHNLLYLGGPAADRSARPVAVQGEMYRAYPIESADTVACRVETAEDVEVFFYASHATGQAIEPRFHLEFEDAVVDYDGNARSLTATTRDGRHTAYGAPDGTPQFQKLFDAVAAVRQPAPRIVCGPEAASAQTAVVDALHRQGAATPFPAERVEGGVADGRLWVPGLEEDLRRCYERGCLPAETGAPWAATGGRR